MLNIRKLQFLTVTILAFATLSLSACNTVDGAGRDIEKAGEAVQDSAR